MNTPKIVLLLEGQGMRQIMIPAFAIKIPSITVLPTVNTEDGLKLIRSNIKIDLVITNLGEIPENGGPTKGLTILKEARKYRPGLAVVVLTGGQNRLPNGYPADAFLRKSEAFVKLEFFLATITELLEAS